MELRQFTIVNGHPATGQGWVYAWVWPDGVHYVGATWLDPAVRAEAHLHLRTDDVRSLALREAVASATAPPQIVAAPTPMATARSLYKVALVERLRAHGLLASHFIDPGPASPADEGAADLDTEWLDGFERCVREAM